MKLKQPYDQGDTNIYQFLETDKSASSILSKRETEVLKWGSLGYRNKAIGDKLFVSESTIKTHIYNMVKKLNVKIRLELVNKAEELEII